MGKRARFQEGVHFHPGNNFVAPPPGESAELGQLMERIEWFRSTAKKQKTNVEKYHSDYRVFCEKHKANENALKLIKANIVEFKESVADKKAEIKSLLEKEDAIATEEKLMEQHGQGCQGILRIFNKHGLKFIIDGAI